MKQKIPWKLLLICWAAALVYIPLLQHSAPDIQYYVYYINYYILDFFLSFFLALWFFLKRDQGQLLFPKLVSYGILLAAFPIIYVPARVLMPYQFNPSTAANTLLNHLLFLAFSIGIVFAWEVFFYLLHRWLIISRRSITLGLTQTISIIVLIVPTSLTIIGLAVNMFVTRGTETSAYPLPVTYPGKFFTTMATQLFPLTGLSAGLGVLSVIIALPFVFFFAWMIAKYFTQRLQTLVQSVNELKYGNLANRVEIKGEDEISRLMGDFNQMADALETSQQALMEKQTKISALMDSQKEWLLKISHELRTPVSTIKALLESSPAENQDEMQQKNAILQQEVDGLYRLIEDLFSLTQSEHAQLSLQLAPFSMPGDLLPLLEPLRRFAWEQKQIELAVMLDPIAGTLQVDRDRLGQVLRNLTQNAVRHTPVGGVISIETERRDDQYIIHIKDTGEGIPQEMLEKIWDPFEKHPRSTGAGIGLTLAKQLVELMHGTITAVSEQGCGACFIIKFPVIH